MRFFTPFLISLAITASAAAAEPIANQMLADYFQREVATIEAQPLPLPGTAEEWETQRAGLRRQLAGMLGLDPMPPRTPLDATGTGELSVDGIVIEKLHYQAMPGLYVTANLYRPAKVEGRLPTILYGCGHSDVKAKDGTSLGNKTHYQHHGAWFARHGYVCLVIDTVQLGEIRGEHHGTYSKGRWWWISRGYTPAGVEAWAGIRGIDYLVSRADVDASRIGVTGRSGGGAYSWWIAALDDRVKVAAPTAGITTLRNHVVDGCVEGHCDCMFMVNTHRWDYDRVAALIAPRPLLISNTDKDTIFPLDGVVSVYSKTRQLYKVLGAEGKIGLQIAEGPHKDVQALNTGAFAWFERWLKGADPMATFDDAAKKIVEAEKLRVFTALPSDERNTRIDQELVPAATPANPANRDEWNRARDGWMSALRREVFAGWPREAAPLRLRDVGRVEHDGVVMRAWDFTPQEPFTLRLWAASRADIKPEQFQRVILNVFDDTGWRTFARRMAGNFGALFDEKERAAADGAGFDALKKQLRAEPIAIAYIAPRGIGPTAWAGSTKQQNHRLRRFYLLGQTLDGMQTYDIRRAITALRATEFSRPSLWLRADGVMSVNALYASLFEPGIAQLVLREPPASHATGPIYLNVLKHLDVPQAAAMAAAASTLRIDTTDKAAWGFPSNTAERLGWSGAFELHAPEAAD